MSIRGFILSDSTKSSEFALGQNAHQKATHQMEKYDLDHMSEAIKLADGCQPREERIPKVGAVIAVEDKVLGRGRRGTGQEGNNEHAEFYALEDVKPYDKARLREATLYTTLEPCTGQVRSVAEKACTELIKDYQIKKVFIGILDPNQGVTGKGLWQLQDSGIEVELFPHDLSKQLRIQNADFIRSQQTLGAEFLSPKHGEKIRTDDNLAYPVRFKCLNPPKTDTYLLTARAGLYWPQSGPPKEVEPGVWEIVAHFGSTGEWAVQLVTADALGSALIQYYRNVTQQNRNRREKLRGKVDMSLLGNDYPGIEMNGLPKGLRLEEFARVAVAYKVNLIATYAAPLTVARDKTLKITYEIESQDDVAMDVTKGIWLGASFRDATGKLFHNTSEDKAISLTKGKHIYERNLTIAKDAPLGEQKLDTNIWRGFAGDSRKSKWIGGASPISITVTG